MAAKKQINVRIAEPLLETVAEAARRRGETVTGVVEKAFEAYVQDAQPQSPPEPADPPAAPEKPAPRARAPRRVTAKVRRPEPTAAQDEGERITAEIEADPDEVARLRHSRQQAREGKAVRWDGPGEPGSLAAAHALAEAVGAPMKMASDLPPAPEPPPALILRYRRVQRAGRRVHPARCAPRISGRAQEALLIRDRSSGQTARCECGEEMYS